MRRVSKFCRSPYAALVACSLAIVAFGGSETRAEIIIDMSVGGGPPIDLIAFTTPLATDPGQLNNYGTVDLTSLNTFLSGAGSAYQFTSLGGSSNYGGASAGGTLSLTGGITLATPGGSTSLTLTEMESGFALPTGATGSLSSTSQGNYSFAGPPNSHDAQSSFNGVSTALYTVGSTIGGVGPDKEQNGATATITSFGTPYTLTNFISFNLVSGTQAPTDNFNVVAGVTATAIPEPASVVAMMIGLPLPLVCFAWLRRHRAAPNA